MNDSSEERGFRTLRGFLDGDEAAVENYFHFSATLRIRGNGVPFEQIEQRLGFAPTLRHRAGERLRPNSPPSREDAWHYQVPLAETEPLGAHLDELWRTIKPHVDYLKSLKNQFRIDVFCGYRSNCDMAGFEVPHQSLELFRARNSFRRFGDYHARLSRHLLHAAVPPQRVSRRAKQRAEQRGADAKYRRRRRRLFQADAADFV